MSGCVFCSIAAGLSPALVIYEDEHTISFLDRLPMTLGHSLVIPKRHVTDIFELTDEDAAHVLSSCAAVARLMAERLEPAGVNVLNNNGAAADQTQFHYHCHVIPRYGNDRLLHPWERTFPMRGELEEAYAQLAGELP